MIRIASNSVVFLLFPYVLLEFIGIKYWKILEQWIFYLTLISLPLYLLNLLNPGFFNNLYSVFHPFTNKTFTYPYWSFFVYVNAIEMDSLIRNCGFMWEPGSYAMMIIWGIIYNWVTKGPKLNWRFLVYTIALMTTFSTAGYLAFAFLFLGKFVKKISLFNLTVAILFIFFFSNVVFQQHFMSEKINEYITTFNNDEYSYDKQYGLVKVNRFQGGYYSLVETLEYPLGYGVISKDDYSNDEEVYGTNGLGSLLKMWGVIPFLYFLFLLNKFLRLLGIAEISRKSYLFFSIALLIMFFSNPIARDSFVYFMLLTPIIFKKGVAKQLVIR